MNDQQPNSESFNSSGFQSNNYGFNTASALQIRMNVREDVLEPFQTYLTGRRVSMVENSDGTISEQVEDIGTPVVNKEGYQAVMSWLTGLLSAQTIQANFIEEKDYNRFMKDLSLSLTCDLMANRKKYGIEINKINGLHKQMVLMAHLILTRAIFNKERDGMNNTLKIHESMQSNQVSKGGFFSGIPFLGGKSK